MASEPYFSPGDRVFSHYTMKWGTIREIDHTNRDRVHGVTGDRLPDTTWYWVDNDDGTDDILDDAHGDWNLARVIPPAIAARYGYGVDPRGLPR